MLELPVRKKNKLPDGLIAVVLVTVPISLEPADGLPVVPELFVLGDLKYVPFR